MLRKLFLILFIFPFFAYPQDAQIFKPDSIRREIEAVKITSNLKIDGLLNDKEWANAKPFSDFTEIDPIQGRKPKNRTEARILYNKQFLYAGFFSKDILYPNFRTRFISENLLPLS